MAHGQHGGAVAHNQALPVVAKPPPLSYVIHGLNGPITVNGKKYNSAMTSQGLNDQQVADVLTYVYSSWGNNKTKVTPAMVKAQRGKK